MFLLLLRRRVLSLRNTIAAFTLYERARNSAFMLAGLGLLFGLYVGFYRLLAYLSTVPLIGSLLLWKLTAMMLLATFTMVVISSLLTSLTTLYYSYDLKFLMNAPIGQRTVFLDKSLEAIFFASWMIGLVLVPYVSALVRVNGYDAGFFAAFLALTAPFLMLAASFGIAFTLILLYCFPSSRTRDVIWVLSSLSLSLVYVLLRYAKPERLVRPDALRFVADYLNFLQAPTAPYLPSWWLTRALSAYVGGKMDVFWGYSGLLCLSTAAVYGGLLFLAGKLYFTGYSGAQEGSLKRLPLCVEEMPELRMVRFLGLERPLAPLFWKERTAFFRDVKHWSQILLIMGLIFVYLFSIYRLPLDNADLKTLISFLNIGTAGFVIAALGLRFTYPSISLEGRSWWLVKAAPVALKTVMRQKLLFSLIPMTGMALTLGLVTNHLLAADPFTSWISVLSLLIITWALCVMGVGFGALFPMFNVENIHQIESSLGGFVYMASSLFYIAATIMILSWPMNMHFQERFGRPQAWSWPLAALSLAALALLNAAAFVLPWKLGRKSLEAHEQ